MEEANVLDWVSLAQNCAIANVSKRLHSLVVGQEPISWVWTWCICTPSWICCPQYHTCWLPSMKALATIFSSLYYDLAGHNLSISGGHSNHKAFELVQIVNRTSVFFFSLSILPFNSVPTESTIKATPTLNNESWIFAIEIVAVRVFLLTCMCASVYILLKR